MTNREVSFRFEGESKERLDRFLAANLSEHSRSRLQNLIRDGFVTVNQVVAHKTGLSLELGDTIRVFIPPQAPADLTPEDIPLEIIFENGDLMVVNKPAGMVVHPAAGHASGTLVQAALFHAPQMEGIGGKIRPGVVHRLDKDTSGLILIAKNDAALHWLQDQFRQRTVKKTYIALVDGAPPTPSGRIETPIGRDPSHRKQMAVVPGHKGRQGITEYHTLEIFPQHTLLEAIPHTGRTHQIRIQFAFIGCPIVADKLYGHHRSTLPLARHFLHAGKLIILLPGETSERTFHAPLPNDLNSALEQLRIKH